MGGKKRGTNVIFYPQPPKLSIYAIKHKKKTPFTRGELFYEKIIVKGFISSYILIMEG